MWFAITTTVQLKMSEYTSKYFLEHLLIICFNKHFCEMQVSHEEIVEHVSSLLTSKGIVYSGKGIDTGNLEWFGITWDHLYSFIYFMNI